MKRSRVVLGIILLAGISLGVAAALRGRNGETRYTTATLDRGDVVEVVGATGTLQAVTTVLVGSQVSGTIQNLYADFNTQVKRGQIIVRLDPSSFEARLGQAKANLSAARANVERSRAALTDTRQKLERSQELAAQKLLPQSDLDTAKTNYDAATAQVKASEAAVSQAEASVNQAQVDLDHTIIATPIDGVVINRAVDVGQTVAASFQAPTLFIIANDLTRMQVNASIDEADIGRVQAGQDVTFRVDAFPDRSFAGRVEQVRLQPQTVQNVVSYNTIISVDNPELKLMPGMTATVSLIVRKSANAVRVPATAMRFRPEGFDMAKWMETARAQRRAEAGGNAPSAGAPDVGASPSASPGGHSTDGFRHGAGGAPGGAPGGAGGFRGAGGPGGMGGAGFRDAGGPGGMGGARAAAFGARGGERGPGVLFVLNDKGVPEPKMVRMGISDGQFVEVRDGLAEGATIVTGIEAGPARAGATTPRPGNSPSANPFQPGPPQQRRRQ